MYLVVLCSSFLHMNTIASDMIYYHLSKLDGTLIFLVSQTLAYLLYPLLGWLADVYFSRYKLVLLSSLTMIAGTLLMMATAAMLLAFPQMRSLFLVAGLSVIVVVLGIGLLESTVIQFGMDQLLEASSSQLSTFIHWYYWSINVGPLISLYLVMLVMVYYSQCKMEINTQNIHDQVFLRVHEVMVACVSALFTAATQLVCACISLCLLITNKKHFCVDQSGQHPIKLICSVVKYAWKHKCPENRSAFTYWEEDIPPRIDLGKVKYGGPFTTEEVEDTKTFFRILLLLVSLVGFNLSGHGYSLLEHLTKTQCLSNWVLMFMGERLHITLLVIVIGVPLYQGISACNRIQKYFPNMLKRMGIGLFCCLIKELASIIILFTMGQGKRCAHLENINIDSCYFLMSQLNDNGTCTELTNITDGEFSCAHHDTPFLLLIIPNLLQGLSFLLVFMTTLEFICAQAPLRLKGLLIGVWYAMLSVNYIFVGIPDIFTSGSNTFEIFYEVKAFLIFLSLVGYMCVSRRYCYRQRDEVVNEQYLIEEIYERELAQAQENELNDNESTLSVHSYRTNYGTAN